MPSTIALHKRVSLADIADGWDDCFAIVSLATYEEGKAVNEFLKAPDKEDEAAKFQAELVASHFISGSVLTTQEDGSTGLGELTAEDATSYMVISNRLFEAIVGLAPDPKGSSTPTEESPTTPSSVSSSN